MPAIVSFDDQMGNAVFSVWNQSCSASPAKIWHMADKDKVENCCQDDCHSDFFCVFENHIQWAGREGLVKNCLKNKVLRGLLAISSILTALARHLLIRRGLLIKECV